ncbi:MAG: hypothetical protein JNK65_05620, partial [Deltaproteobacteria bacterium]|nr:hypothetical protein [Deltaproteobacteria bacterium]
PLEIAQAITKNPNAPEDLYPHFIRFRSNSLEGPLVEGEGHPLEDKIQEDDLKMQIEKGLVTEAVLEDLLQDEDYHLSIVKSPLVTSDMLCDIALSSQDENVLQRILEHPETPQNILEAMSAHFTLDQEKALLLKNPSYRASKKAYESLWADLNDSNVWLGLAQNRFTPREILQRIFWEGNLVESRAAAANLGID